MTIIYCSDTIRLPADHKKVFGYLSDLKNDRSWRKEINSTIMSGPPQVGALATESSFLSKKVPEHTLVLKCMELEENRRIVYQTLPDSGFYLRSERVVEPLADKTCRVTYSLAFDMGIVRHGLGFGLPKFMVDMVAKRDMKKYLRKLKALMETLAADN